MAKEDWGGLTLDDFNEIIDGAVLSVDAEMESIVDEVWEESNESEEEQ